MTLVREQGIAENGFRPVTQAHKSTPCFTDNYELVDCITKSEPAQACTLYSRPTLFNSGRGIPLMFTLPMISTMQAKGIRPFVFDIL